MKTVLKRHALEDQQAQESAKTFHFHSQSIERCLRYLGTQKEGLTDENVQSRRKELKQAKKSLFNFKQARHLVSKGVKNLISILLVSAAVVSFVMMDPIQGWVILGVWIAHTGIQIFVEWQSHQTRRQLDEPMLNRCQVRRAGVKQTVEPKELVPGDILILTNGYMVPADARLIWSENLQVDESLLTGESILVPKNANAIHHVDEEITSQYNMVFSGTRVKTGKGEAVVTAIGAESAMGKIENLAQKTERRQPGFTGELNVLVNRMLLLVLIVAAFVLATEYSKGAPTLELVRLGIVLLVAVIPGVLPSIVNLVYSKGLEFLALKEIIVKDVQALEAISTVNTLCSDKTGTLTENYLMLDQLYMPELENVPYDPRWQDWRELPHRSIEELFRVARLNNSTQFDGLRSALLGDPIDLALYRSAPRFVEEGYIKKQELPFDPQKMRSATLCEDSDKQLMWMIKGAPEAILDICTTYMRPDGTSAPIPYSAHYLMEMFNRDIDFENNYRVIGLAKKTLTPDTNGDPYVEATFIGWVCLVDPPREGAPEAIEQLDSIGVKTMMITGDQKATAETAARELGIIVHESEEIWLYKELEQCEGDVPATVRGFARTKPEDKLTIVDSLQENGFKVAMVGDGINDTPALQKSDVAIAMGKKGAEAALANADIILLNDKLEGILSVIQQSRLLGKKIQSCMLYLISSSLGMLFFLAGSSLAGKGLALSITEVLWLNLVIVTIPTVVLALEPSKEHEFSIERVSAKPYELFDRDHLALLLGWGALMMVGPLFVFFINLFVFNESVEASSTLAFCTLAFCQVLNLFNVQSVGIFQDFQLFLMDLIRSPMTWGVILMVIALQALAVYTPGLSTILGTVALDPVQLLVAFVAACANTCLISMLTVEEV